MKKVLAWLLIGLLTAALFVGCSKNEPSLQEAIQQNTTQTHSDLPQKPAEEETEKPEPSVEADAAADGELFDAGNVTALVPAGWKAFPELDVFAEEENTMDPDILNVSKGGETDLDLFTMPYVRITYFGPEIEMMRPDSDWYEEVEDVAPFTAGDHRWEGFSCVSLGAPLTILWCEEGDIQYQAVLSLCEGADAISADDPDVRAILASVTPSEPHGAAADTEPAADPVSSESYWDGQWYGWWCIRDGMGDYEKFSDIAWDIYAVIEDYEDGTGYLTMWDTETTKDSPLVRGYLTFEEGVGEHPALVSDYCTFYDGGEWLPEAVDVVPMDFDNWYVDPAVSTVSHFEDMVEIVNYYEDPNNEDNYFAYYIYLRPWGADWEDVRGGDTSGCIYSDMMPLFYDDWYLPLVELGVEEIPDSLQDGIALLEGGTETGTDGEMTVERLKELLEWAKHGTDYDTTYEEVVAAFGMEGTFVDEYEAFDKPFCRYRWFADEENYITITFEVKEDGSKTWNVTTWEGLD